MNELRDTAVARALLRDIGRKTARYGRSVRIMEVCGTHTMVIHRHGLKRLLEEAGIEMISGPGCPVCITPDAFHEACLRLVTQKEDIILATFGDMTRVPTRLGSLQAAVPASRSRIVIVYSPQAALDLAVRTPDKDVVFFGVGFETTIPAIAVTAKKAAAMRLGNFSLLSALWLIPPALRSILEAGETAIDGFLYPGHVSAIIGLEPYRFVPREYGIPGAVAGFEPNDILLAIDAVLDQLAAGTPGVFLEYRRVVKENGNPLARRLMEEILQPADARWRGLGKIPRSGLELKPEYSAFDARKKFDLVIGEDDGALPGCRCGDILRGLIPPPSCPLFGKACRPDSPHGPCMVSLEGACLNVFKYREQ